MPKGILTRFIVEMHRDIENVSDPENALVWKNGVILNNHTARAEIIENYYKREIVIRVSGNRPRDFMTIINRKFIEIHDVFNLKPNDYDTLIPCNCTVCQPNSNPFTFPLQRLYSCLDQKRFTIQCHESGENVDVRGLIDDVITPNFDYLDRFDPGYPEGFSRRSHPSYPDYRSQPRRNYLDEREPQPVIIENHSHIYNTQQQEKTMNNDKHLHGDIVRGDKVMGDKDTVSGNKMRTGDVAGDAIAGNKIVTSQNLAEAAKEIQDLMDQLSTTYNTDSRAAKNAFADEIITQIDHDPTLAGRLLSASKAGGIAAIGQFLNHPLASFVIAALEDWERTHV